MADLTQIKDILGSVGDWVSTNITQPFIHWIGSLGANVSVFQSKIINLVIISLLLIATFTLLSKLRTAIKFGLIIFLLILGVSIMFSF